MLSPESSRLLCLIAALSTAGPVSADIRTLAARMSMDIEAVRTRVATLVADGLVARELGGRAPVTTAGVEYRLTFSGWDVFDDMAAVNPRTDLDAKHREYARATAQVSRFPNFADPVAPGGASAAIDGDFATAVEAEELARHRYHRALARYDEHQRQRVAVG